MMCVFLLFFKKIYVPPNEKILVFVIFSVTIRPLITIPIFKRLQFEIAEGVNDK